MWRQGIDGTAVTNGDLAYDVAVDSAGDVVAVGVLDNAGTDEDLTVVKLDGVSGAEVSRLSVDGPGMRDEAFTVAVDAAGDAMVGGRIQNGFAVLKVDGALGAELWRYTLPSPISVRHVRRRGKARCRHEQSGTAWTLQGQGGTLGFGGLSGSVGPRRSTPA